MAAATRPEGLFASRDSRPSAPLFACSTFHHFSPSPPLAARAPLPPPNPTPSLAEQDFADAQAASAASAASAADWRAAAEAAEASSRRAEDGLDRMFAALRAS